MTTGGERTFEVRFRRGGPSSQQLTIEFASAEDEAAFRRLFLNDDGQDVEGHGLRASAAGLAIASVILLGGAGGARALTEDAAGPAPIGVYVDPAASDADIPAALPDTRTIDPDVIAAAGEAPRTLPDTATAPAQPEAGATE